MRCRVVEKITEAGEIKLGRQELAKYSPARVHG
jgi:hypothetical protein